MDYPIRPVHRNEVVRALQVALSAEPPARRRVLISQALVQSATQPRAFDGLLAAFDGQRMLGSIWIVELAGRTAVTGLPRCVAVEDEPLIHRLMHSANQWLESRDLTLNQVVLDPSQRERWEPFLDGQHHPIAIELAYVAREATGAAADIHLPDGLALIGHDESRVTDWERIYQRTLIESRDCLPLRGHRSAADTVVGYRATGDSGCELWWRIHDSDRDVGCLLMARRRRFPQLEIVYVGLSPEARGRGVGRMVLEFAVDHARRLGMHGVFAAVDLANGPATAAYHQAGFRECDRRVARIRLLGRSDGIARSTGEDASCS